MNKANLVNLNHNPSKTDTYTDSVAVDLLSLLAVLAYLIGYKTSTQGHGHHG